MFYVGATAGTAGIIVSQLEHTELAALRDVGRNAASLLKDLVSFLVGAHLLEHRRIFGLVSDDLVRDLVQRSHKRLLVIRVNSAEVLNVGASRKMVTFGGFQVRPSSLGHGNIQKVTGRVHARVQPPLGFID